MWETQQNNNKKLSPMKTVVISWSKKISSFGVCRRIYGRNQPVVNKRIKEKLKKLQERKRNEETDGEPRKAHGKETQRNTDCSILGWGWHDI